MYTHGFIEEVTWGYNYLCLQLASFSVLCLASSKALNFVFPFISIWKPEKEEENQYYLLFIQQTMSTDVERII